MGKVRSVVALESQNRSLVITSKALQHEHAASLCRFCIHATVFYNYWSLGRQVTPHRLVFYNAAVAESDESARLVNVRRFLMGMTSDRSADVLSLLSPTVVYTVPGEGPMSGVFRGPAEVHEHIAELFRITSGTFEVLKWVDWLVGLNHIAALQTAQAQGSGAIFRGNVVYVVETDQHDLLSSIRLFFENQVAAEAFFGRLRWE